MRCWEFPQFVRIAKENYSIGSHFANLLDGGFKCCSPSLLATSAMQSVVSNVFQKKNPEIIWETIPNHFFRTYFSHGWLKHLFISVQYLVKSWERFSKTHHFQSGMFAENIYPQNDEFMSKRHEKRIFPTVLWIWNPWNLFWPWKRSFPCKYGVILGVCFGGMLKHP